MWALFRQKEEKDISMSKSRKLICMSCLQIARSTDRNPALICGRCNMPMRIVNYQPALPAELDLPPEPSLDDLNRGLDS